MSSRTKRNLGYIVDKMDDGMSALFMAREALSHVDLSDAPETFSILEKADMRECEEEINVLIETIHDTHRRYLALLGAYGEARQ